MNQIEEALANLIARYPKSVQIAAVMCTIDDGKLVAILFGAISAIAILGLTTIDRIGDAQVAVLLATLIMSQWMMHVHIRAVDLLKKALRIMEGK